LLHNRKYEGIQDYLKGLTPTEVTSYLLWTATRYMKRLSTPHTTNTNKPKHLGQNRQKEATAFAEQLASVFHPFRPSCW
jgi:hypothetical protein